MNLLLIFCIRFKALDALAKDEQAPTGGGRERGWGLRSPRWHACGDPVRQVWPVVPACNEEQRQPGHS